MSTRYQILQHEQKPYWLPGCPLLMASHALTKDTTTDLVFLQCKFENLSNKRIKALTIHVECYDVTNQPFGYNEYGQCNISGWKNIKQLSAGIDYTVGLRTNGTCIMTGDNQQGQCNVSNWTDITYISSSFHYVVGLKRDGTVVVTGDDSYFDEQELSHWRNIIAIAAGGGHTVGLKRDGTVVAAGGNNAGQCNVSDWTDIIAIVAGSNRTIGIKADGTLVATGGNEDGQCNVNGIKLW